MSCTVLPKTPPAQHGPVVDPGNDRATRHGVLAMMVVGLCFTACSVQRDVDVSGGRTGSILV